ncbi:predicted protein [Naegleria gruberi]|uniref:Predicted protein n=1 Tax=Naegleria gruberi TaxID=5762 RepID=D2UX19_NAEGR|nr:uncharacterized protein NAEGRDRAFT_61605 [Naegleria gruberi]EFC50545.1 predicted protein [Naegleria gruberi]|eukprot:XP_002683289.1 predicted protein [Naegleria gruberi strain NEG-M]
MQAQVNFNQIKSSIFVPLDKKKSDQHCSLLFSNLIGTALQFRDNKYTYCGSYDLSQWLVLCFNTMVKQDEKLFADIVIPLVAYISIVDDACDEKITDISIEEMKSHCMIFRGESVQATNPAHKMGKLVYNLIKDSRFDGIRGKILEFLTVGTNLIEKAKNECENNGLVSEETLLAFLKERRVDSMSSLFFTINNFFNDIPEIDTCDHVIEYNHLACDIISLFNDVASIAKDAKKVVNNYIILNKGLKEGMSYSQLKQLPVEAFDSSLNEVLELIKEKLQQMETIKSSNPDNSKQFESIDEVMKGYCTWCIISKRFQHSNHLLPEYHSKKSVLKAMIETVLMPFLKPWSDNDMLTYLDDIENSMKKSSFSSILDSFAYSIGKFCSFSITN